MAPWTQINKMESRISHESKSVAFVQLLLEGVIKNKYSEN